MVQTHFEQNRLNAFPVFLAVADRPVVIIGDGDEALAKARLLAQSSARLRLIAEAPEAALATWAAEAAIPIIDRAWNEDDLSDAVLVFAATGDEGADRAIVDAARRRRVPVNAVDRPELCDFFTPALVNRAPVAVAIGTEGTGPVLSQLIRAAIDRMLSPRLGQVAQVASGLRERVNGTLPPGAARRRFWNAFFAGAPARAIERGEDTAAHDAAGVLLGEVLRKAMSSSGSVSLVGAGPGAEDLLTLRAHRLLMEADVIVYDALVPETVVALGRRDAERIAVGKRKGCHSRPQSEISRLLVELARDGKRVVRLKSGDPLVFGRAAEEMDALREARIPFDIVPGVTSALAAAADFELPPTLRGVSSSLVLTTGHDLKGEALPDWAGLAAKGATIAIYMGRSNAADVASRLLQAGVSPDTAVVVVEHASLARKRMLHGVLADLHRLEARDDLAGPVMTIVGDAVAAANLERSEPLAHHQPEPVAA